MPELPEVETIINELSGYVLGRKIISITINDSKPVKIPLEQFTSGLAGQTIIKLSRRGKYLVFQLSNGKYLIMHLRMTGTVLINPLKPGKYARVIFGLDNRDEMVFSDRRRLGVMWLTDNTSELEKKLGPEPLSGDFSIGVFSERLKKRKAPVKAVLLDQKVFAGLGNMYADESLFAARIHPLKKAADLSRKELVRLHGAIVSVLREAIENKGASVDSYIRPDGTRGTAHESFKVAHRRGKKCPRCGTPIQRIVVGGRGTYFCPKCQRI